MEDMLDGDLRRRRLLLHRGGQYKVMPQLGCAPEAVQLFWHNGKRMRFLHDIYLTVDGGLAAGLCGKDVVQELGCFRQVP